MSELLVFGDPAGELDEYAERIVTAAEAQLVEFGLERTSLDRIAAAAGVSRGTLFRRFSTRDGLMRAVIDRQVRLLIGEIDAEVATGPTPEQRLLNGVRAAIRAVTGHRLLQRLLETDRDEMLRLLNSDANPMFTVGRAYVAAQIAAARDDGMPIAANPRILAEVLVRLAHSLLLFPQTMLPLDDDAGYAAYVLPLLRGASDTREV